jgi:methyl-accepting chemotaxis protein
VATGEISSAVVKSAEKVKPIFEKIEQIAGNAQNAARNILESSKGIKDIAVSAADISTVPMRSPGMLKNLQSSIYKPLP